MASATTPDGIVYPDASDPIAPLNAVFQDLAESVQEALDTIVPGAESLPDLSDVTITSPADGQLLTYDGAVWVNEVPAVPAGSVLQVVSVTKTDLFTMSSATFAPITGYSATITPSSSSNKILVLTDLNMNVRSAIVGMVKLFRDAVELGAGDVAGSRVRAFSGLYTATEGSTLVGGSFLDSPATTSALTYSAQIRAASGTIAINSSGSDSDQSGNARMSSTITLMEVAG